MDLLPHQYTQTHTNTFFPSLPYMVLERSLLPLQPFALRGVAKRSQYFTNTAKQPPWYPATLPSWTAETQPAPCPSRNSLNLALCFCYATLSQIKWWHRVLQLTTEEQNIFLLYFFYKCFIVLHGEKKALKLLINYNYLGFFFLLEF